MNRRGFLSLLAASAVVGGTSVPKLFAQGIGAQAPPTSGTTTGDYDFWFTRLMYDSGDWDVDQRMPANLVTSLIDYTGLRVDPKEHVLALSDAV